MGNVLTGYNINDTLLVGQSVQQTTAVVQTSAKFLEQLGFIIHTDKSVFTPKQEIVYL